MTELAQDLEAVRRRGRITAEDAQRLRARVYGALAITPEEAELLIRADEAAPERDPAWTALFLEALTDFLVRQQSPAGYVDEANADWLIARVSKDGCVRTDTELELLVRVLETAERAPERLVTFALQQVKAAVVDGEGPLGLRRILFAAAGAGGLAITRAEAEILFDLNDACRHQPNDPAWTDLFTRALAASVMAASGYEAPSREEAARRELWLSQGPDVGGFLRRMFAKPDAKGALAAITGRAPSPHALQHEAMSNRTRAAEPVDAGEAAWLVGRIGKDGAFDAAERRLVEFLRQESPNIHPALRPLLDQAADEAPRASFGMRRR